MSPCWRMGLVWIWIMASLVARAADRRITIQGRSRAGETFERPFGPYLFRLGPRQSHASPGELRPDGWTVSVVSMGNPKVLGPAQRLDIVGTNAEVGKPVPFVFWLGATREDKTGVLDVWRHPAGHRDLMGLGTLTLESLHTEGSGPTTSARLVGMTFKVTLEWQDPAPFDVEEALIALYGPADPATGHRAWRHSDLGLGKGPVKAELLQMIPFEQERRSRFLLLTKVNEPDLDCHPCRPGLGAALYTLKGGRWALDLAVPFILALGHSGGIPQGQLVFLGPAHLGLLFRVGDAHQGTRHEASVLVMGGKGGFKEGVTVPWTAADVLGHPCFATAGERATAQREAESDLEARASSLDFVRRTPNCWSFDSTFRFVPGPEGGLPLMEVVTEGTKSGTWTLGDSEWDEGPIAPFRLVRRYRFEKGAYRGPL